MIFWDCWLCRIDRVLFLQRSHMNKHVFVVFVLGTSFDWAIVAHVIWCFHFMATLSAVKLPVYLFWWMPHLLFTLSEAFLVPFTHQWENVQNLWLSKSGNGFQTMTPDIKNLKLFPVLLTVYLTFQMKRLYVMYLQNVDNQDFCVVHEKNNNRKWC